MAFVSDRRMIEALVEKPLQGLLFGLEEDLFPPRRLAGVLDWYFAACISGWMRAGRLTGKKGEVAYLPVLKKNRVYHFLAIGIGPSKKGAEHRWGLPTSVLQRVVQNLKALPPGPFGLSPQEWTDVVLENLVANVQGGQLWIPTHPRTLS